jgi:hypothetical protein
MGLEGMEIPQTVRLRFACVRPCCRCKRCSNDGSLSITLARDHDACARVRETGRGKRGQKQPEASPRPSRITYLSTTPDAYIPPTRFLFQIYDFHLVLLAQARCEPNHPTLEGSSVANNRPSPCRALPFRKRRVCSCAPAYMVQSYANTSSFISHLRCKFRQ